MDSSVSEIGHFHKCKYGFESKLKNWMANSLRAVSSWSTLFLHCLLWSAGLKEFRHKKWTRIMVLSINTYNAMGRFIRHKIGVIFLIHCICMKIGFVWNDKSYFLAKVWKWIKMSSAAIFSHMLSVNPCIVFDARNINLSKVISVVYKLYLWWSY